MLSKSKKYLELSNQKNSRVFSACVFATCLSIGLSGCLDNDRTTTIKDAITETPPESTGANANASFVANFSISEKKFPTTNNLLRDGTLNLPASDDDTEGQATLKTALNTIDGFSTIVPITTTFNASVDSTSIVAGTSVRVFQVIIDESDNVTSIVRELEGGAEFIATIISDDGDESTAAIIPLRPLSAKTSYLVAITNAVKNATGDQASEALGYKVLKSGAIAESKLEEFTISSDANNAIPDLSGADVILSWNFTTQSTSDVLDNVYATVQASSPVSSVNPSVASPSPQAAANIHVGTLEVPYYLSAPTATNPTAALSGFWLGEGGSLVTQDNPTPVVTSTQRIPLILTVPVIGTKPDSGWPIVIFQHGITSNRTSILGIADTLASVGIASVGIDLPLHGLMGDEVLTGAFKALTAAFDPNVTERHFEMDLVLETTTPATPGPDQVLDSSGAHFINLRSILTSRDNVRQAVVDLFTLRKAIDSLDYDGGGADFDTNKVYFYGHSLGAVVGGTFLAIEQNVKAAVLAMPGGGIAKFIDGSSSFGPVVSAGLAANGVIKGTPEYESFMGAMQIALDSSDPINYASSIAANRGVLVFDIVGSSTSPSDLVIPNNVPSNPDTLTVGSPTAGTDPLVTLMGLSKVNTSQTDVAEGSGLKVWARFTVGHHSSALTPNDMFGNADADSFAAFAEMQGQMASFLATNGAALTISDPSNIVAAP